MRTLFTSALPPNLGRRGKPPEALSDLLVDVSSDEQVFPRIHRSSLHSSRPLQSSSSCHSLSISNAGNWARAGASVDDIGVGMRAYFGVRRDQENIARSINSLPTLTSLNPPSLQAGAGFLHPGSYTAAAQFPPSPNKASYRSFNHYRVRNSYYSTPDTSLHHQYTDQEWARSFVQRAQLSPSPGPHLLDPSDSDEDCLALSDSELMTNQQRRHSIYTLHRKMARIRELLSRNVTSHVAEDMVESSLWTKQRGLKGHKHKPFKSSKYNILSNVQLQKEEALDALQCGIAGHKAKFVSRRDSTGKRTHRRRHSDPSLKLLHPRIITRLNQTHELRRQMMEARQAEERDRLAYIRAVENRNKSLKMAETLEASQKLAEIKRKQVMEHIAAEEIARLQRHENEKQFRESHKLELRRRKMDFQEYKQQIIAERLSAANKHKQMLEQVAERRRLEALPALLEDRRKKHEYLELMKQREQNRAERLVQMSRVPNEVLDDRDKQEQQRLKDVAQRKADMVNKHREAQLEKQRIVEQNRLKQKALEEQQKQEKLKREQERRLEYQRQLEEKEAKKQQEEEEQIQKRKLAAEQTMIKAERSERIREQRKLEQQQKQQEEFEQKLALKLAKEAKLAEESRLQAAEQDRLKEERRQKKLEAKRKLDEENQLKLEELENKKVKKLEDKLRKQAEQDTKLAEEVSRKAEAKEKRREKRMEAQQEEAQIRQEKAQAVAAKKQQLAKKKADKKEATILQESQKQDAKKEKQKAKAAAALEKKQQEEAIQEEKEQSDPEATQRKKQQEEASLEKEEQAKADAALEDQQQREAIRQREADAALKKQQEQDAIQQKKEAALKKKEQQEANRKERKRKRQEELAAKTAQQQALKRAKREEAARLAKDKLAQKTRGASQTATADLEVPDGSKDDIAQDLVEDVDVSDAQADESVFEEDLSTEGPSDSEQSAKDQVSDAETIEEPTEIADGFQLMQFPSDLEMSAQLRLALTVSCMAVQIGPDYGRLVELAGYIKAMLTDVDFSSAVDDHDVGLVREILNERLPEELLREIVVLHSGSRNRRSSTVAVDIDQENALMQVQPVEVKSSASSLENLMSMLAPRTTHKPVRIFDMITELELALEQEELTDMSNMSPLERAAAIQERERQLSEISVDPSPDPTPRPAPQKKHETPKKPPPKTKIEKALDKTRLGKKLQQRKIRQRRQDLLKFAQREETKQLRKQREDALAVHRNQINQFQQAQADKIKARERSAQEQQEMEAKEVELKELAREKELAELQKAVDHERKLKSFQESLMSNFLGKQDHTRESEGLSQSSHGELGSTTDITSAPTVSSPTIMTISVTGPQQQTDDVLGPTSVITDAKSDIPHTALHYPRLDNSLEYEDPEHQEDDKSAMAVDNCIEVSDLETTSLRKKPPVARQITLKEASKAIRGRRSKRGSVDYGSSEIELNESALTAIFGTPAPISSSLKLYLSDRPTSSRPRTSPRGELHSLHTDRPRTSPGVHSRSNSENVDDSDATQKKSVSDIPKTDAFWWQKASSPAESNTVQDYSQENPLSPHFNRHVWRILQSPTD